MGLFFRYLQTKWRPALLLAAFAVIFAVVFSLYGLPAEAVGYGALLCAVLGLGALIGDFFLVRRDQMAIRDVRRHISAVAGELPRPRTLPEGEYRLLCRALYDRLTEEEGRHSETLADLLDYYTMWAHQIKTPIAAMGLLLQEPEGPDRGELAGQLFKVEQYVDMVLQYLKLETRSSDFVIREHSLDEIVRQTIRRYKKSFIRSGVRLVYGGVEERVLTDERLLGFVLEQLLSNALKYTPEGEITVAMDPERAHTLVVRDTGIGIRPEDLPRVMEKGFTGYNGRAEGRATGIGLYLAARMCRRLGHTIEISSTPGQGKEVRLGLDSLDLRPE